MSTSKVLIVVGAQRAGKTHTIGKNRREGLKARLTHVFGRHHFSYQGKGILVYAGSCQERKKFCHVDEVNECISERLREAKRRDCSILVTPFTMWLNREGELNEECITDPIAQIRAKRMKVRLVYLRKKSAGGVELMDRLMIRLGAVTIRSERNDNRRQTEELWRIFLHFDP